MTAIPQASPEVIARIMRCFRVKLINRFVQNTQIEVYLDAQKVQALQACQRLRQYNRMFDFNPKDLGLPVEHTELFKYETSALLENFPYNYLPMQFCEDGDEKFKDRPKPE
jgi:hypothetical protein